MSFPRYPEYKDCGVEWLGEVPGHWETIPLNRTATEDKSLFIDGDWIESKDLSDDGIRYLTSGNVGDGYYKEQGQGYISEETFAALNCEEVIPGDVLISRLNLPIGRSCLVPDLGGRIVTCVDNVIVRPDPDFDRGFFVYQLTSKSHFANMENLARGTTMQRISRSVLGRVRFAFPPLPEQTRIAAFLDRETAKIDALVAAQRRLMELLKEKRQAVISHAVTRGLNPKAQMKPSGIEWLGDVPAHWGTPAMYMRYSSELGKMLDSAKITGDHLIPYMRNVDVQWGAINFEDLPSMDIHENDYERYTVKGGDLLVCEGGEVGRAAIVPAISGIFGYQKALHRLRALDGSEDSRFMYFTLLWAANTGIFDQSGSSTIAHLTGEQLSKYRFPKPPVAEQKAIAQHLEAESAKFDALTTEAQRAIDLLQERRTALISAAVTGQIDVRSMVLT